MTAKPIIAFGDSITTGNSLSNPDTQSYISLVAAALGVSKELRAVSGQMAADQSFEKLYGTVPDNAHYYTCLIGTNDANRYGTDPVKRAAFIEFYRNILVWNLCPTKKLPRNLSDFVASAGWADTPVNSIGRQSSTPGSYLETEVFGKSIYVSYYIHTSSASTFDIYVDNVLKKSVVSQGSLVGPTFFDRNFAPACTRVGDLSEGAHTVRVVVTSGNAFIDFIAGASQNIRPEFFAGDILHRTTAAYVAPDNAANTAAYNTAIATMIGELSSDGHKAYPVHHDGIFIVPDDYAGSDGLHPLAAGHAKIATSFLNVMQPISRLPDFNPGVSHLGLYKTTFIGNPIIF